MDYSVSLRKRFGGAWTAFILCGLLGADPEGSFAGAATEPSVVRVVPSENGFQLVRNGTPYLIKGVGGSGSLEALAKAGGNSVRTWGEDGVGPILDQAQKLGLTVAVGIWLGHERHGFDYNNADQVAEQYERARKTILRYKDHPALLLWGLGNEMEGFGKGDNAAIWSAVNNIAGMAKRLDPNHPTMTVIAEIGGDKVKNVNRLCPDVDILGINSYGGVSSIPKRYKAAGGIKPYVITEFGPPGTWESTKNAWGVVPEPTSTDKADYYRRGYQHAVLDARGISLGSYAFTWGHKQEATATWFGMLLPDGSRLAAVDALTELWTGKPPANRCPIITSLALGGPDQVEPGATIHATLRAKDPEGDPVDVRWVLQREVAVFSVGGDKEDVPPTFPSAIIKNESDRAEVRFPKEGGGYRLFAYVRDDHSALAVANFPILVKGPIAKPQARQAKLPLVVYDEAGRDRPPFVPTGWMGNIKAMKVDEQCETRPHAGKSCLKVEYHAGDAWGGIVWQDPPNDWGDRPEGWDVTGVQRLAFWARGEKGGETVSFELGLIGRDKPFYDTTKAKLERVKLSNEWTQYHMDIRGDLTRIKSGFVVTFAGSGAPITFYLDDISYE